MFKEIIYTILATLSIPLIPLHADTKGKIEVGASYVHIDLIESDMTMKEIDMPAVRVEGAWCFYRGAYIKPFAMWGKKDESELTTAGVSLGMCMPVGKCLLFSPSIGVNYTHLITTIELAFGEGFMFVADETFKGWAPNIGLEITYCIQDNFRISVSGQYAWSRSETDIREVLNVTSDSQGPAYAAMVEYDFNPCWSINAAAAYNESYSKEKNGIRGRGAKLGLVRWF